MENKKINCIVIHGCPSNVKKAIITTSTNDLEVHNACEGLAHYDWPDLYGSTIDLDGKIIHVDGLFSSDITTTVYRK